MRKKGNGNVGNRRVLQRNRVPVMKPDMEKSVSHPSRTIDPTKPPRFITVAEAAQEMRVSTKWFWEQIRMNVGPRVRRIGKVKIRIPYDEFVKWCENPPTKAHARPKQRKIAP